MLDPVAALLPALRVRPETSEVLMEEGNINEGAGMRISVMPEFVLVEVHTDDTTVEVWIPIDDLLASLGRQFRSKES